MKRIVFLFALLLSLTATSLFAQEICNNGIDDDNDGFIDCFDNQCANNSACNGSYIGNDALCEAKPSQFPAFKMTLDWASPNKVTNHLNRMSIGDLDRDGIPEVVLTNKEGNSEGIYILRGSNGTIKHSNTSLPFSLQREVAIANLDNDNCAEVFVYGIESNTRYLYAYSCDLSTQLWRSAPLDGDPGLFGFADFNGDGQVEIYFRDVILNAHSGVKLADSPLAIDEVNISPVAINMVGDVNLELVNGLRIFTVNIGAGTITEHSRRNEYFLRNGWEGSHTSVADYNLDGNLDIVASGSTVQDNPNTNVNEANTTVFFWDVTNNTLKTFSDPIPGDFTIQNCDPANNNNSDFSTGKYYQSGWHRGTGRINIADADGDGQLNAVYVSGKFLYALDHNLNLLWRKTVSEETSGFTGCTMFDFNGDGRSEIVYRDEKNLFIINGVNGNTYTSQPCISRTSLDYPIVADVDADGQSELCVTCGFDDALALANFCNIGYSENSHVRVFRTDLEPWVPARRVWNQNAYFNVNVNDDLTIPRRQQNTQTIFSPVGCDPANPRPTRPLNTFLNQSPFLNSLGCPKYASPDLSFVDGSLVVNAPTCPATNFTVSFTIENLGDVPVNGNLPVTFYKGNPLLPGAIKLNTITANLGSLTPGNQFAITNATVTGDGSPFRLYIAINDSGNSGPSPIKFPNTNILECDYDNIVSADVDPLPATITAQLVQNNIKCVGSVTPNNGSVRAFVPVGATENTTDYNFFWSNGPSVTAPPAFTGPIYSGLDNGTFSVYAVHKTANCSSDTVDVNVIRIDRSIPVTIQLNSPNTNCQIPNGELEAAVTGEPIANFNFEWFSGNDTSDPTKKIGVNEIATGLIDGVYTIRVTDKNSGCQAVESLTVPDQTVKPVPTITKQDIACSNSNIGSVSATVGGTTAGFTFRWYNGTAVKPAPDFTGSNYTNRGAGNYTLVVINSVSKCSSDTLTVSIVQTTAFTVNATKISDQTSCDPDPDKSLGSASASVGGVTAGYTFEWFRGQNTLTPNPNPDPLPSTPSITNLPTGIYTVKATNDVTGCFATDEVTINTNIVIPGLTLAAVGGVTICDPPNGTITAGVTLDTPADYDFAWYNGTVVDGTPDFATTTNVLTGLPVGTYTVKATHKTKFCTTAPISATVTDNTPTLSLQLEDSDPPTDCNALDGFLEIGVSAAGNTGGFKVEWFKNNEPNAFREDPNTQFSSAASGLQSANYRIRVTNRDNNCTAEKVFPLPFERSQILTLIDSANTKTCDPKNEGEIIVNLVPSFLLGTPRVYNSTSDFTILVYQGQEAVGVPYRQVNGNTGVTLPPDNDPDSVDFTIGTLVSGFYTLVAVPDPSIGNCPSVPVVVEILPFDKRPVITLNGTPINNTNCVDPAVPGNTSGNGQIEAMADVAKGANQTDYTFKWYAGPDVNSTEVPNTGGVKNNIALNLDGGQYTVEVTNNLTKCPASTATFTLINTPPIISLSDADLTTDAQTLCINNTTNLTNLIPDAGAQINQIRENGIAVPFSLTDYEVKWFNQSNPSISTTNAITNQLAGTYFVSIRNRNNNCLENLYEVELEDQTIGTVSVSLADFKPINQCSQTEPNQSGLLEITPSGTSTSGYFITWFEGEGTASQIPGATSAVLSNIMVPAGQDSVKRTVLVVNRTNFCQIEETYVMPLEIFTPGLAASAASPMTSCVTFNGSVFATVTTGGSDNYTYTWSSANFSTPRSGKEITGLDIGEYTVEAVDKADASCRVSAKVNIEDGKQDPVISAVQAAPLTVCDLSRADGVANVTTAGNLADYIFNWYVGNTVNGTPFYTGIQAGGLEAITYTVEATHVVTGCTGSASITIGQNILTVPAPTVNVLSNVTQCDLTATLPTPVSNGALAADINGNTKDYIFDWSDGNTISSPADFTGEIYASLSRGTYSVIATSRITGCVSPPALGEIIELLDRPEFDFSVINAACGLENGFISFNMTNSLSVSTVEWFQNGTLLSTEPVLINVPEGNYSLRVRSSLGCPNEREVSVGTEIRPFNGVSRNGDGKNDLFAIACIESFPSNMVKIFNRAGTLVYEAPGYDNIDVYFDGKSNKGFSPLGNNLPDGTYFYVIDKGDGSKPVAGYLEIVN